MVLLGSPATVLNLRILAGFDLSPTSGVRENDRKYIKKEKWVY
jgi:hypothetical protein